MWIADARATRVLQRARRLLHRGRDEPDDRRDQQQRGGDRDQQRRPLRPHPHGEATVDRSAHDVQHERAEQAGEVGCRGPREPDGEHRDQDARAPSPPTALRRRAHADRRHGGRAVGGSGALHVHRSGRRRRAHDRRAPEGGTTSSE
jgi:hypothetical protein